MFTVLVTIKRCSSVSKNTAPRCAKVSVSRRSEKVRSPQACADAFGSA
jgi:hypothetical protein